MSKFGSFISRRPSVPAVSDKSVVADKIVSPEIYASLPESEKRHRVVDLDSELFLPIARQLGEENESIRNLLIDAEHKINELDSIKREIGKLAEPVSKKLRTLEETKCKLGTAEKKIAALESECARLQEDLIATQQKFTALESAKAEQTTELAARNAQISDLQSRMLQQHEEIQAARDENRGLTERGALLDRQKAQLDKDLEATAQKLETTRQKLAATETDRANVQKSLEKALAESSQLSQRLLATDKAFEEAKQRYESNIALHMESYEALKTRADLTSKLLEDTRTGMLERAKEIQSSIAA